MYIVGNGKSYPDYQQAAHQHRYCHQQASSSDQSACGSYRNSSAQIPPQSHGTFAGAEPQQCCSSPGSRCQVNTAFNPQAQHSSMHSQCPQPAMASTVHEYSSPWPVSAAHEYSSGWQQQPVTSVNHASGGGNGMSNHKTRYCDFASHVTANDHRQMIEHNMRPKSHQQQHQQLSDGFRPATSSVQHGFTVAPVTIRTCLISGGPKKRMILSVDNLAQVSGRKVCSMHYCQMQHNFRGGEDLCKLCKEYLYTLICKMQVLHISCTFLPLTVAKLSVPKCSLAFWPTL